MTEVGSLKLVEQDVKLHPIEVPFNPPEGCCSIGAMQALTGVPFDRCLVEVLKFTGKKNVSSGVTCLAFQGAMRALGFETKYDGTNPIQMWMKLAPGWPKSLKSVVEELHGAKAQLSVTWDGRADLAHAIAVADGKICDVMVSQEPVTPEVWIEKLRMQHRGHGCSMLEDTEVVEVIRVLPKSEPEELKEAA